MHNLNFDNSENLEGAALNAAALKQNEPFKVFRYQRRNSSDC